MKHGSYKNPKATVTRKATPANRRMNAPANVTKSPTPANRKMNAPARVKDC